MDKPTYKITSIQAVLDGDEDGGDYARGLSAHEANERLASARDWYPDCQIVRERVEVAR